MKEHDYDMLKTLMHSFKRECEGSYNEERADVFGQLYGVIHKFLMRKNKL
tara:strand:+ start:6834 stop:6983 length:150 start_codon:yes stop_codon:yes gene_type:complete